MTEKISEKTLNDLFESHPIMKKQLELRKDQVLNVYSDLVDSSSYDRWHHALYKFATVAPHYYVDRETIQLARTFFNDDPRLTLDAVKSQSFGISHAIFSMLRPGDSWNREQRLSLDKPDQLNEFDSIWHPEYQRYSEHVLNHLIQIPLWMIGTKRSKNYIDLALSNRIERLQIEGLGRLTNGFDPIIRNAISHGSTKFEIADLNYIDKRSNRSLSATEFSVLFDDLVETCNSILVGIILFVCDQKFLVTKRGLHQLPLGLRFVFIDGFTSHVNFELLPMIESTALGNRSQLNIVCRLSTRARWVQLFEGFFVCWQAVKFGGENYDRFNVGFDLGMPVTSSLFVNGGRLREAINKNETITQSGQEIIESNLLWYKGSRIEGKLYSWKSLVAIQIPLIKRNIIKEWKQRGLDVLRSRYEIIEIINISTDTQRRLEAHLVLHETGTIIDEMLCSIVNHAIRRLRKSKIQKVDLTGPIGYAGKPQHIRIRMYAVKKRIRTLQSYGWANEGLIVIAEWNRSRADPIYFYTQDFHYSDRNIRIKFNPGLIRKNDHS